MRISATALQRAWPRALLLASCLGATLALACGVQAPGAAGALLDAPGTGQSPQGNPGAAKPSASATLEQCVTAVAQAERSATFSGEMTAISGSTRMEMRIDVLERMPSEELFHTVSAPGLGVWRTAAPGVKVYKYLKQVTNLSAPAFYRASVRLRWLNAKGRLIKSLALHTPRCEQPQPPPPPPVTAPSAGVPAGSG
jgi:hypothetical protein